MFTFAVQARKLLYMPHIPLLEERNTRDGFFEQHQLASVLAHLPAPLRPVIVFAFITGWRIRSEVLSLEWRQVAFAAGEVRLDPETTKNRDGRVFPFTAELRAVLEAQHAAAEQAKKDGHLTPWVFFRMVATGRGGEKSPKPIRAFTKVWKRACIAAGCPGRIPHDFRRTAVRNMVRRGIPERVAMQLTGHKTRSVFDRYHIVAASDLTEAAARLENVTTVPPDGASVGQVATVHGLDEGESGRKPERNWRRRPDLNRGWRFCRQGRDVYLVDSSCFLVGPTPPFSPVFGRNCSQVVPRFGDCERLMPTPQSRLPGSEEPGNTPPQG